VSRESNPATLKQKEKQQSDQGRIERKKAQASWTAKEGEWPKKKTRR